MKYLLGMLVMILSGCSTMTEGGMQVRVVDHENANFIAQCDFIGGQKISSFSTWNAGDSEFLAQARNKAYKHGADTIVMHSTDYWAGAIFDMYRCR